MIKKLFWTKEKKQKIKEVENFLKNLVLPSIEKHLDTNDPKVYALTPHEFILGVTEILLEEKLMREGKLVPVVMKNPGMYQEEQQAPIAPSKKTFH